MQSIDVIKQFLESMIIAKKMRKYFKKNLVMSVEDEERFQLSNKYWICN